MPDWVIHIGVGYLVTRIVSREDVSWALIGSILPDVIARIEVILIDIFRLFIFLDFSFSCFHTPFMLACLSAAIALLTVRPGRIFSILFGFSLLHMFLDMLEVHVPGFGVLLFFPFSFKPYSFNVFNFKGIGYLVVYGLFFLLLLSTFFRKNTLPAVRWTRRYIKWAMLLIIFLAAFPFYASRIMAEHNVGDIQFLTAPEKWEGKKVNLHVSRVISSNPVIVEEGNFFFEVATDRKILKGDWISIYGTYREGKIFPEIIIPQTGSYKKSLLSGAGLLYLIVFFAFNRKIHFDSAVSG